MIRLSPARRWTIGVLSTGLRGGATTETLTVYWRPGCPYSMRLKARLRLARSPFHPIDIWDDPDAAAVVRSVDHGDELVPTVRIGADRYLSNPSSRELAAALDDGGARRCPEE